MKYLVFNTFRSAYGANAVISQNMRLSGSVTVAYAEIQERLDGKFVILAPTTTVGAVEMLDDTLMAYVSDYTVEDYVEGWFPLTPAE